MIKKANLISLKDFRLYTTKYINKVKQGETFTVLKKNEPAFTITYPELYDFSTIKETNATPEEKKSILAGKKDFEKGNFVSFDEIKKRHAW